MKIEHIDKSQYHFYRVRGGADQERNQLDSHLFTPGELLELATWVEQHRTQLEQEAQEDGERDRRAWEQDMADMAQIKREWRNYRLEGGETPPWKVQS